MAVTHSTVVRTGIADYVVDTIDTGGAAGNLIFYTASAAEVATLAFAATAFAAAVSGTATAAAITDDTSATGNAENIATAEAQTSTGGVVFICSVTATGGGGDIEMSGGIQVTAGATVSCSTLSYSAPS